MADYKTVVYNTTLSITQDAALADDIAQEVFITIFRSIGSFKGNSGLSTWIYRITVNKCLDHVRMQKRIAWFKSASDYSAIEQSVAQRPFDHPGVLLEQREQARYLFAAIRTLPLNQQTAFVLAHVEDLPQKEIAAIMDISLKAVESLLQRAKSGLRKKLEPIYDRRKTQ